MRARIAWLILGGSIGALGAMDAACSSSDGAANDAGIDGGAPDGTADVPANDAGLDTGNNPDLGLVDTGPLANCSPVTGPCDLVSQNCPMGHECVAIAEPDGGYTTACSQATPSEHLPKGHACCPSATANPCLPGLECIGTACSDAGGGGGRCTPHCCSDPDGGHDDTPCGKSDPELIPGHCDLSITGNTMQTLYSVCTYSSVCTPLQVQPCQPNYECLVTDNAGTSSCVELYAPDGGTGLTEGQPCQTANDCADGLMCFSATDGGFACYWLCYVQNQPTPFDAGVLNNQPGHGGCPGIEQCASNTQALPNWLGLCVP